jgi:hypothetical protein
MIVFQTRHLVNNLLHSVQFPNLLTFFADLFYVFKSVTCNQLIVSDITKSLNYKSFY